MQGEVRCADEEWGDWSELKWSEVWEGSRDRELEMEWRSAVCEMFEICATLVMWEIWFVIASGDL